MKGLIFGILLGGALSVAVTIGFHLSPPVAFICGMGLGGLGNVVGMAIFE